MHHKTNPGVRAGARIGAWSGRTCAPEYTKAIPPKATGPGGRRALAILSAWSDLPLGEAEIFADFVVDDISAGPPLPPFTTLQAEADAWATFASTREIKTYIAAAVARLSPADRAALAAYLGRLG